MHVYIILSYHNDISHIYKYQYKKSPSTLCPYHFILIYSSFFKEYFCRLCNLRLFAGTLEISYINIPLYIYLYIYIRYLINIHYCDYYYFWSYYWREISLLLDSVLHYYYHSIFYFCCYHHHYLTFDYYYYYYY